MSVYGYMSLSEDQDKTYESFVSILYDRNSN